MFRAILVALAFVMFGGCAHIALVTAQKDGGYHLNKDLPLFLELGKEISITDKNAYSILRSVLEQSGFKMTDRLDDAKLVITFRIFTRRSPGYYYRGYYDDYYPYPDYRGHNSGGSFGHSSRGFSHHSGGVGHFGGHFGHWGHGYYGHWHVHGAPWYGSYGPYLWWRELHEKTLELRLFDAASFRAGTRVPLWEGTVSARAETFDAKLQESANALIDKVGQDFQGSIHLQY